MKCPANVPEMSGEWSVCMCTLTYSERGIIEIMSGCVSLLLLLLVSVYPDVSHHPSPLDCTSVRHVAWQLDVLLLFGCLAYGFARLMFCHWVETSGKQVCAGPFFLQSFKMCLTHIGNCDWNPKLQDVFNTRWELQLNCNCNQSQILPWWLFQLPWCFRGHNHNPWRLQARPSFLSLVSRS